MRSWLPGTVIVVQEVWRGRLWAARPVVVVADGDDQIVLWSPQGTRRKVPVTPEARPEAPTRGEQHANSLALLYRPHPRAHSRRVGRDRSEPEASHKTWARRSGQPGGRPQITTCCRSQGSTRRAGTKRVHQVGHGRARASTTRAQEPVSFQRESARACPRGDARPLLVLPS